MSVTKQYIKETVVVQGRRLGRHVVHDEASKEHPAHKASKIVDVLHQNYGPLLDQGDVGSCTGESLVEAGNSSPNASAIVRASPRGQDAAYKVYGVETKLERQPWPPNDPGGSGLMVCKAGKQLGWVKSYRHAFGLEHALLALVLKPVMFGVNWYDSFDHPDPRTGVVKIAPRATVRGGHEICAEEIKAADQLVGFVQSWGGWGLNGTGRFYIPFHDVERLLAEQGDATVPTFN